MVNILNAYYSLIFDFSLNSKDLIKKRLKTHNSGSDNIRQLKDRGL
jgi:hypothetical protein